MDEEFFDNIYGILMEVPMGCVTTYGQLARLAARPQNARLVGKALRMADLYGDFPCHRVVGHDGRLAPDFDEQRTLLEEEGVLFKENGKVDMKKCLWKV